MGNCKHCGGKAGFLRRKHQECDAAYQTGRQQMVALVIEAAGRPDFSEPALLGELSAIAGGSFMDEDGIRAALAEGWRQSVKESLADGILTQDEEVRLRDFREQLAITEQEKPARAGGGELRRAARDRLSQEAQEAALAPAADAGSQLAALETALQGSELSPEDQRKLLARAWTDAVDDALADGAISLADENALLGYLRHFSLEQSEVSRKGAYKKVASAGWDRLLQQARRAAIDPAGSSGNGSSGKGSAGHLTALDRALRESNLELSGEERRKLLVQGWEAAVEGSLEDGVLTLDEENALICYLRHFGLSQYSVNDNGAHTSMIQAAVIREAAEGIIPDRLGDIGRVPFNLMKSEKLVWVFDGVDYYEVRTRRERRGTSHGASIRIAKGLYYRPSTFSSRTEEWEETARMDTGLLGVTSKHLYFHGPRKRFRIRYDRIVSFDPYKDGIGVMRDAQTAKPQTFKTGDGWFIYNLVTNLAQQ